MSAPELPATTTLRLRLDDGVLHLTLARPEARNAMSAVMITELLATFAAIRDRRDKE